MTARYFVDTNVLLYAGSNAPADAPKRAMAAGLLQHPAIGFSAQVLQEFYVNVTQKIKAPLSKSAAREVVRERSEGTFANHAGCCRIT